MASEAVNIATNGLVKSQKQATRVAGDIIKTVSANTTEPKGTKTGHPKFLVHHVVEFKQVHFQFRANAAVFKTATEMLNLSTGIFVDKKS